MLKIVIDAQETKRVFIGNFAICGDGHSLLTLAHAIINQVGDEQAYYGWVSVFEPPDMPSHANTAPKNWDD